MFNTSIIQDMNGKEVEVYTVKSSFVGTLRFDNSRSTLIVTPKPRSYSYYGAAMIAQSAVIAIREVFPVPDNEDEEDSDSCDKMSDRKSMSLLKGI
jgi:hypothetical protein